MERPPTTTDADRTPAATVATAAADRLTAAAVRLTARGSSHSLACRFCAPPPPPLLGRGENRENRDPHSVTYIYHINTGIIYNKNRDPHSVTYIYIINTCIVYNKNRDPHSVT